MCVSFHRRVPAARQGEGSCNLGKLMPQVNAPLAIKTRIHTSSAPNTMLDPIQRTDVYLEVLMQNTSPEVMAFNKIVLEPVYGLTCVDVTSPSALPSSSLSHNPASSALSAGRTIPLPLYPNDTRQHLFLLRYTPPPATKGTLSVFPPFFPGGTILPLGRLDVGWIAGKYAEPGRLQTSTLNRRTAVTPIAPTVTVTSFDSGGARPEPSRTSTAAAPMAGAGIGVSAPSTPAKSPRGLMGRQVEEEEWEYDLAVLQNTHNGGLTEEEEMVVKVRVAIRSLRVCKAEDEVAPPPIILGVQHISPSFAPTGSDLHEPIRQTHAAAPSIAFSPPSPGRSTSPLPGTPGSSRPFSPGTTASRPTTPLSTKLRQATAAGLTPNRGLTPTPALSRTVSAATASEDGSGLLPAAPIAIVDIPTPLTSVAPAFPPRPYSSTPAKATSSATEKPGEVYLLGNTLTLTQPLRFVQAQEQYHTSYAESTEPPTRWEAVAEVDMRHVAIREGLADLGGVRVLHMGRKAVGREWESLGQVEVKPW